MTVSPSAPKTPPLDSKTVIHNLAVVLIPMLGFLGAICAAIFWEGRVYPLDIALLVGMYVVSIGGITVGYHRLFAHRTFQTGPVMRALIAISGAMAAQGSVAGWVSHHRRHHFHSDEPGDVHSPHLHGGGLSGALLGFWHSHMGWMISTKWQAPFPHVGDLTRDPVVSTVDRYYYVWLVLTLSLPAAIGGLVTGSWDGVFRGLIWGGAIRLLLGFNHTFCVNSLCHLWGGRMFETPEKSRNNGLVAFLTLGEGWHNNHHAFPSSAQFGMKWWQFDPGWWFIQTLDRLGLAWDVKVPSQQEKERYN